MTILDKILKEKKKEISCLKQECRVDQSRSVPIRSFVDRCKQTEEVNVIAEFKRASPSKGLIQDQAEPAKQAKHYEAAGASMISVLTDAPFFQGSMEDLKQIRQAVSLPILNKDFILDPIQIDRAYEAGADVILLIVAALTDEKLHELFHYAQNKGLEVLVEVHNKEELLRAQNLSAELIGVNNRNLKTFEVDVAQTESLAKEMDLSKYVLVSESGMKEVADVKRAHQAGAQAILVGETVMKATNVKETIAAFRQVGVSHES